MTLNAEELAFVQTHQVSVTRGQRPRLHADHRLLLSQTLAPANSTAPMVTGTGTVGSTLTSTMGTWTNSPVGYAAQWYRGATPIAGATTATYKLVAADSGTSVTCHVTATTGGGSATSTSNAIVVA